MTRANYEPARESVTADDTGGDKADELKEPDTKKPAAEGTYETAGRNPEGLFRDTTALGDITIDDSSDCGLMGTDDPRDPGKETGLEDIAANMPLRRTQRVRKKTRNAESF